MLAKVPSMYVLNAEVPAKTPKQFIALAKSWPGQLNYGSAGNGSAGHLAFGYLKMVSGIFVLHVPYRGTGPQLTDLLASRLDAASVCALAILAHIKSGKLLTLLRAPKNAWPSCLTGRQSPKAVSPALK